MLCHHPVAHALTHTDKEPAEALGHNGGRRPPGPGDDPTGDGMATSRTGTASHKRFRKQVLNAGLAAGVSRCPMPGCGVELDYTRGKQPNSAEPDHILPHAYGGTNDADNGRVICRKCNQSRGKGDRVKREDSPPVTFSPIW